MNLWKRLKIAWYFQKSLDPNLMERALQLVTQEDDRTNGSGEYKRHQVYARLIKEFPDTKRSTLALVIEVVICGL